MQTRKRIEKSEFWRPKDNNYDDSLSKLKLDVWLDHSQNVEQIKQLF